MTGRRPCVPCVAILLAIALGGGVSVLVALPATAASPSPVATAPARIPSLTGHWAIVGTSGLDLVQVGSSLTGTSAMGVSLSGSVEGRTVTFRWWRGATYDRAKKADRGSGAMLVSEDGNSLSIAGKDDEAGPGPFPTRYAAVRVVDIIAQPSKAPSWYDSWTAFYGSNDSITIASVGRAYLDYVVVCWVFTLQTGYWPSSAVAWIQVEDRYRADNRLLIGGWLPNGGGPALQPSPTKMTP